MSLGGKVVISGIKMTMDLVETVLVSIWIQKKKKKKPDLNMMTVMQTILEGNAVTIL